MPFVQNFCSDCHNDNKQKGDLNLAPFIANPHDPRFGEDLEYMLDMVETEDMPPQKKFIKQPTQGERAQAVKIMRAHLQANPLGQASTVAGNRIDLSAANNVHHQLPDFVPAFVDEFCMDCHNNEEEKGDRNFEPFMADPQSPDNHLALEEILEQLNLGEMPPPKKRKQPSSDERRAVVQAITKFMIMHEQDSAATSTVLRRLTRFEYNHTMRDLVGAHPTSSDPTENFPADQKPHGFANVGATQVLSDYQLHEYMSAARHYLDQSLVFNEKQPSPRKFGFAPKDFNGKKTITWRNYRVLARNGRYFDIGHGEPASVA